MVVLIVIALIIIYTINCNSNNRSYWWVKLNNEIGSKKRDKIQTVSIWNDLFEIILRCFDKISGISIEI